MPNNRMQTASGSDRIFSTAELGAEATATFGRSLPLAVRKGSTRRVTFDYPKFDVRSFAARHRLNAAYSVNRAREQAGPQAHEQLRFSPMLYGPLAHARGSPE